ncbi:hypothetical protein B0T14DRAFT_153811 [Immersiella caudata]|uniref:Uncharacterized protein n=1 Tax=Immersiella caudata TaxID=314043 RepID=A0AA39WWE1_9PEZI|nr:hypothetical protein B0T14DRAFT_153811 [Immersiella caudata]
MEVKGVRHPSGRTQCCFWWTDEENADKGGPWSLFTLGIWRQPFFLLLLGRRTDTVPIHAFSARLASPAPHPQHLHRSRLQPIRSSRWSSASPTAPVSPKTLDINVPARPISGTYQPLRRRPAPPNGRRSNGAEKEPPGFLLHGLGHHVTGAEKGSTFITLKKGAPSGKHGCSRDQTRPHPLGP